MAVTKTKRIPVSERIWKQLGKEKEAGETYDDLIQKLLQSYHRLNLMRKIKNVEEMDSDALVDIDEL